MIIDGDRNVIHPAGSGAGGTEQGPARAERKIRPEDAVEISGEARAGTHKIWQPDLKPTESEMSATLNQVRAVLRERIRSGFYDSEGVLGTIAGKMLDLFGL